MQFDNTPFLNCYYIIVKNVKLKYFETLLVFYLFFKFKLCQQTISDALI